mmetsp:Transcript_51087/g.102602  ORF Transcript_51087/g.102602 Transcript_51087/m.102602 type:complete len:357 (+) Transcript_51087:49-1119(+)
MIELLTRILLATLPLTTALLVPASLQTIAIQQSSRMATLEHSTAALSAGALSMADVLRWAPLPQIPDPEFDGLSPLALHLDTEGSAVLYFPHVEGLDEGATIEALESALSASEITGQPPPEDTSTRSGRRQWLGDFGLGWPGPRRWRRGSWRLQGKEQLAPVLAIREAIDAVIRAAVQAMEAADRDDNQGHLGREANGVEAADGSTEAENMFVDHTQTYQPRLLETFNSVLVNRYTDGKATIKWHADDDRWYCCHSDETKHNRKQKRNNIVIASVSLGAERWFEFRRKPKGRPNERRHFRIRLRSGSLLVMAGATQQYWHHSLPADSTCDKVRYNLTFRRVLTSEEDPKLLQVLDN